MGERLVEFTLGLALVQEADDHLTLLGRWLRSKVARGYLAQVEISSVGVEKVWRARRIVRLAAAGSLSRSAVAVAAVAILVGRR